MAVQDSRLNHCNICKDYSDPLYLQSCPGCRLDNICGGCFLTTKDGAQKRCLKCAAPFCRDCGREDTGTSKLKTFINKEEGIELKVCPVCESENISLVESTDSVPPTIRGKTKMNDEGPPYGKDICDICSGWINYYDIAECMFCGTENVGICCTLPVENNEKTMNRCIRCAVPICKKCIWYGHGTECLDKNENGELVCPNCGSREIVAAVNKINIRVYTTKPKSPRDETSDPSNTGGSSGQIPNAFKEVIQNIEELDKL